MSPNVDMVASPQSVKLGRIASTLAPRVTSRGFTLSQLNGGQLVMVSHDGDNQVVVPVTAEAMMEFINQAAPIISGLAVSSANVESF